MNDLDDKKSIISSSERKFDNGYYEVREKAYGIITYFAVLFSLCAIVAIFVTLPMANNYVNNVYYRVQHEMDFCKVIFIFELRYNIFYTFFIKNTL